MSSTASPVDAANASVKQDSPPELVDSRVCQIDVSAKSEEDLNHYMVALAGEVLDDSPYLYDTPDTRGLKPYTSRYASCNQPILIGNAPWQDKARHAIWTKLEQQLPSGNSLRAPPTIIFSERTTEEGVIDVVFDSLDACKVIEDLQDIRLDGVDDESHVFSRTVVTHDLPGNVIVVQCIGLPIDSLDPEDLLTAFKIIAKPVGRVLGIAKIVIGSERWKLKHHYSGAVRAQVEIRPENMTMPWEQLMFGLPSHLRCNGFPYPLVYPCREMREDDLFSPDFCVASLYERARSKAAASSGKHPRGASEVEDSKGKVAKKIKCNKEEREGENGE